MNTCKCPFDVRSTVQQTYGEHHTARKYPVSSRKSIFLQFWKTWKMCFIKIIVQRVPYDTG